MLGRRELRLAEWTGVICLLAGGFGAATGHATFSGKMPPPSFSTEPGLDPGFAWSAHDYAIRCESHAITVDVDAPGDWEGKVSGGRFRSGHFTVRRPMAEGEALTVLFREAGARARHRFHARCLPANFPEYHFSRTGAGGPPFFVIQMNQGNYVAIFNRDGVPVWWFAAGRPAWDAELLSDGTLAWIPVAAHRAQTGKLTGKFRVYSLRGTLVRVVDAAHDLPTDIHELLRLPNGNYLLGAQLPEAHVDTTPYGGSSTDDTVTGLELQELTAKGRLVWKWDSEDHIGLDETPPRWWAQIHGSLFHNDVVHFNAVEPDGRFYLVSFRHLDAVYRIDRRTGHIAWKLGGTQTSKSLDVRQDPHADYPLGGQHDVRRQPDGTITIHDNRTGLGQSPRAVRYRVNEDRGTARLVESFTEPEVPTSSCCGSARRLGSGDWLVNWGSNGYVAGYDPTGQRLFKLETPGEASYRADPVPRGALRARQLRHGMNALAR